MSHLPVTWLFLLLYRLRHFWIEKVAFQWLTRFSTRQMAVTKSDGCMQETLHKTIDIYIYELNASQAIRYQWENWSENCPLACYASLPLSKYNRNFLPCRMVISKFNISICDFASGIMRCFCISSRNFIIFYLAYGICSCLNSAKFEKICCQNDSWDRSPWRNRIARMQ